MDINILKTSLKFNGILFRLAILPLFLLFVTSGISQNCNATLEVEKNRSFKAVAEDGAVFKLFIKNTTNNTQYYYLKSTFKKQSCDNGIRKSKKQNVLLDVFINSQSKQISKNDKIKVSPGNTETVLLTAKTLKDTPVNVWSCVDVSLIAEKCNVAVDTILLSVYVPDATEN